MVGIVGRLFHAASGDLRTFPSSIRRTARPLSQYTVAVGPPRPQPPEKDKKLDPTTPPFDHDVGIKHTRSPNPAWSWCQKVDGTSCGRSWIDGEKEGWKTVCTADEDPTTVYTLLNSGVVPRPIALVSTISQDGVENLAPFSWFGMMCHRPPIVAFACLDAAPGRLKDTAENIKHSSGGFVVNIVSEPIVEHVNATSIDAPPEVDEWTLSGLGKLPSVRVRASRVKEGAFSMECQLYQTIPIVDPSPSSEGTAYTTTLILAHVLCIHVRKDVLTERGTVDIAKFKPVARLGENLYARVGDVFRLSRPSWARDEPEIKEALERTRTGTDGDYSHHPPFEPTGCNILSRQL